MIIEFIRWNTASIKWKWYNTNFWLLYNQYIIFFLSSLIITFMMSYMMICLIKGVDFLFN